VAIFWVRRNFFSPTLLTPYGIAKNPSSHPQTRFPELFPRLAAGGKSPTTLPLGADHRHCCGPEYLATRLSISCFHVPTFTRYSGGPKEPPRKSFPWWCFEHDLEPIGSSGGRIQAWAFAVEKKRKATDFKLPLSPLHCAGTIGPNKGTVRTPKGAPQNSRPPCKTRRPGRPNGGPGNCKPKNPLRGQF